MNELETDAMLARLGQGTLHMIRDDILDIDGPMPNATLRFLRLIENHWIDWTDEQWTSRGLPREWSQGIDVGP